MRFLLLGPLEAWEEGRALPLGGPKQRTVLAQLLLQANRVVTSERLIDAVWADEPPESARNTLQTYVRHLRQLVGAERIQHRSSGYVLQAGPDEVDVLRFQAMVEDARRLAAKDLPGAVTALREALGLWRGPALDDLADQASLGSDIARLEEVRLTALEERIGAELDLGLHRELVSEIEELVGRHRYRERLWRDLVIALYRSGRQGDALNAYQRARRILADELGIDPSPELQRLQEQVLRQDPALELRGERLRGYRLLEEIGRGAFGTVHRAFQPEVGREVAVKVIGRRLADDPEFIRRFGVEAQLVARLEHPHIVPLYDYWREPDGAYLVMRYLRGGSLRQALVGGPLDAGRALRLTEQIALALDSAHRQGVIHRDVKPENVLFDEDGNAYLSDFGIAKDLAAADLGDGNGHSPFAYYLSPEEARGEPLTPQTDLYGLGVVLYEALAGRHPFADSGPDRILERLAREPIPSLRERRPELPPAVDEVIARATATEPAGRYPNVMAFAAALRGALATATAEPIEVEVGEARNPFKGLHAFLEADAGDFFGREHAVLDLVGMLADEPVACRFLAVVGPSGSGKSSLVRAGLVPALRGGALRGAETWFMVHMVPGPHPFEELAAGLTRIAVARPAELVAHLREDGGLGRAVDEILPADGSELLVVVDQFEEVFSLVTDEQERARFLRMIERAVADPAARVRVVVTLRADFFDRPLLYGGFGELLANRTYAVTPLSVEDLERAIAGPAETVGLRVEPRLLTEIVAEVAGRPAALPLLQYALTELFEGRSGPTLTLDTFRSIGGVSGALARRAEALYGSLDDGGRQAAHQLFLRLVAVGEDGSQNTRRRALRSDLATLEVDRIALDAALDAFGSRRLLSFDRDPTTRGPTVEIAHEALLREWERLRTWIETARDELRLHARVAAAAAEWTEAGRSDDYLLAGDRLSQTEEAVRTGSVRMTGRERDLLQASRARAESEAQAERERQDRELRLERRSVSRLRALVAVLAAAALVAASLTVAAVNRSHLGDLQNRRDTVSRLTAGSIASVRTDPQLSLSLALHAVNEASSLGEPVPSSTVEALHWAMQGAGIQYPAGPWPVKLVAGPLGTRGVFDVPLARLTALARAHVTRSLTGQECQQYFGNSTCPRLQGATPPSIRAEPVRAVPPAIAGQPLSGTEVTVYMEFDPQSSRQADFQYQALQFTKRTGIGVRLVGVPTFVDWLGGKTLPQNPPDIAYFVQPGGLVRLAREGYLADLGAYLDTDRLRQDTSPSLVSLGTIGADGSWPSKSGATYGAFARLSLKSLVWYPAPEFRAAGYVVPRTWDELTALSDRMVADGHTPWCMGFKSGFASGWPGTDWIENLLLSGAGPEAYDRWVTHDLHFDSPEVREAFQRFGRIVFNNGYLRGGAARAAQAGFLTAQQPMVRREPPGCWLYQFPSYAANFLPPGSVGRDTDVFAFPPAVEGTPRTLIGGGEMIGAFADRPEVREVVRYLLSPEFSNRSSELGQGTIVANRRFDLKRYPPFWREQAALVYQAMAADTFRIDASDLMPPEVGGELFWKAMMTYMEQGPDSLDGLLTQLDAAWPDAPT